MDDLISRKEAIDAVNKNRDSVFHDSVHYEDAVYGISKLPSAQPEWNNHTVACLLADVFGDKCACNFNGIDEWLPEKCEVIDACPDPGGVACWEQYLKYRAERRTDERKKVSCC